MYNYNKFSNNLKDFFVNFSTKISEGLSRPLLKFVNDMIFGIVKSNSVLLSDISRALNENIKLKDTIDRLSQNLERISDKLDIIWRNYFSSIKHKIDDDTIFNIDNSDVIKPYGNMFQDLDTVKDGSSSNNSLEKGYLITEIVAITNDNKHPISVYSKIFSTVQKGFKSINDETFKALNTIHKFFGSIGTCVLDRGYDDSKIFKYFLAKSWNFIIRGKNNRSVIKDGKKYNILDLANDYKGKINIKLFIKGKVLNKKCSFMNVILPSINKEVTVIFVYFKNDVAIFYTNKPITCKKDCIRIVNSYYMRWRVEEYFKYKKQQFKFEDFRVRSLNKINSLNALLSMSINAIGLIVNKDNKMMTLIKSLSKPIKDKVYFEYYRITDGIFILMSRITIGVRHLFTIKMSKRDHQLSLFDDLIFTS